MFLQSCIGVATIDWRSTPLHELPTHTHTPKKKKKKKKKKTTSHLDFFYHILIISNWHNSKCPPQKWGDVRTTTKINIAKNIATTKVLATRAMTRLTTTDGGATKTQVVGAIGVVKWNLILVSLIPHPHTLICQHLGLQYHFVDTSILLVFCFGSSQNKGNK